MTTHTPSRHPKPFQTVVYATVLTAAIIFVAAAITRAPYSQLAHYTHNDANEVRAG